jgi:hypothetical protein
MILLAGDIFALKSISLLFFSFSTSSSFSQALDDFNLLYYTKGIIGTTGTTVSGIGFDSDSSDSYLDLAFVHICMEYRKLQSAYSVCMSPGVWPHVPILGPICLRDQTISNDATSHPHRKPGVILVMHAFR